MVFFSFLLVKEIYKNDILALGTAAVFAFMPQLVTKLAAGVSELQPFGVIIPVVLFALYALAISRKDLVVSILVGFVALVSAFGTNTGIWSFSVLGVFLILQSFIDFLTSKIEKEKLILNSILAIGAVLGFVLFSAFWGWEPSLSFSTSLLLLISGAIFYALFFALQTYKAKIPLSAPQLVGILIFVLLLTSIATPLGGKLVGFVSSGAATGFAGGALTKTVQEENPTTEGMYESSFGAFGITKKDATGNVVTYKDENGEDKISFITSPNLMLAAIALVLAAIAIFALYENKSYLWAVVLALFALSVTLFNKIFDSFVTSTFASFFAGQDYLLSFVLSDVFIFMSLALVAGIIIALFYKELKNPILLLLIIAVFPVSFVGMNKAKYMLFLGVALALAFPFLVGELLAFIEMISSKFKLLNAKNFAIAAIVVTLLFVLPVAGIQMSTAKTSMDQLKATRIPQDWIDAYAFMDKNFPKDARVISWWDYGHWTVFFGERKGVTDPGNNYPWLNQEVAHAFVAGTREELVATMKRHNATYVLFDAELIPKWGALNYLQSTWNESLNNYNPCNKEWEKGPGASKCEASYSYELLYIGQQCQNTLVPMVELQSNLGFKWCIPVKNNQVGDKMYLQTRNGLDMEHPRSVAVFSDEVKAKDPADLQNTSVLIPYQQGTLLNINPDFSAVGLENHYFNSNYAQLFFLEKLNGFEVVYKSQNGQVKLYKLTE